MNIRHYVTNEDLTFIIIEPDKQIYFYSSSQRTTITVKTANNWFIYHDVNFKVIERFLKDLYDCDLENFPANGVDTEYFSTNIRITKYAQQPLYRLRINAHRDYKLYIDLLPQTVIELSQLYPLLYGE